MLKLGPNVGWLDGCSEIEGFVDGFPVGISDGPKLGCKDGFLDIDGYWEG